MDLKKLKVKNVKKCSDRYIRKLVQKNKNGRERIYLQLVKLYRVGKKVNSGTKLV